MIYILLATLVLFVGACSIYLVLWLSRVRSGIRDRRQSATRNPQSDAPLCAFGPGSDFRTTWPRPSASSFSNPKSPIPNPQSEASDVA